MSEYPTIPGDEGGGRTTPGLPYMQKIDIEAMAREIEARKPCKVLEYGAGVSSTYWAKRYEFIKLWVAVEHQPQWAISVAGQRVPNVMVILSGNDAIETYVDPPETLVPFDMIIVDGVLREECIEQSHKWLAPDGVVLLHDADRPGMQQFEKTYPHFEYLTHGNTPDDDGYMERDGVLMLWGDE